MLRQTGLHARPRLRRHDRSIAVSFTDGSAVRVTADAVILETAARRTRGMSGLFARGFATLRSWIDNTDGSAWPFPAPTFPGIPLAGTVAALRRHIAKRIQTAEVMCLHDDPTRRATMLEMLCAEFGTREVPGGSPEIPPQSHVLVLTPDCVADLADEPAWYLDRLNGWRTAHPDLGVITLAQEPSSARFSSLTDLVDKLGADIRDPAEEPDHPNGASMASW